MSETKDITTISVSARELRRGLTAVLPHAGRDDTLPALTCVLFEVSSSALFLVTTDRYTIGCARLAIPGRPSGTVPDASALLPARSARALRRLLRRADGVVALILGDGQVTADIGSNRTTGGWPAEPATFPKWRPMLGKMLAGEPGELGAGHGMAPENLERFTACGGRRGPGFEPLSMRVVRTGGSAAPSVLFARGSWFLGALISMRRGDGEQAETDSTWTDWAAVVTAPEREPVTADA